MSLSDSEALEVERIVKQIMGAATAPIAALKDGTLTSDGHRVLNFQGAGVTVADDPGSRRTNINIPGAPTATTTTTIVSTIAAKSQNVSPATTASDTAYPGWKTIAFSDAGWGATVAAATAGSVAPPSGSTAIWDSSPRPNTDPAQKLLLRQSFTLPAGTITGATLSGTFDGWGEIYLNGNYYGQGGNPSGAGSGAITPATVSPSVLVAGGTNVIAVEGHDLARTVPHNRFGSFKLVVTYSGAGTDPQYELVANKGAVSGYCELDGSGLVPSDDLGTGTPSAATFLRGDQSWATLTAASITIDEVDGSPAVTATHLSFPNGTLTDNGGGHATYAPAAGASVTPKLVLLSSALSTTSTSLTPIDSTNLGYTQFSLTLAVGDIVEGILQGEFYYSSGSNSFYLDMQIHPPTGADVYSTSHASPPWRQAVDGTRQVQTAHFWFVAGAAGAHTFRPVWKTAGGTMNLDGVSTPTQFVLKNLGH